MAALRAFVLSCLATAASWSSTVEVLNGPWVLARPDGGSEVAIEVPAGAADLGALRLDLAGGVSVAAQAPRPLRRPQQAPSAVVAFSVPPQRSGPFAISGPGLRRTGLLPVPPGDDATTRLLVAGAGNWPEPAAIARAAEAAGGPPHLVLASGPGLERVLGTGGWEATLPIAVIASEPTPGERALAGGAIIADGLRVGAFGLAVASDLGAAATVFATTPSPWQVPVVPGAAWDPGVLAAAHRRDPSGLAAAVALAARLRLPLVLATGGLGGAVSEPLAVDGRGVVRFAPAGPRAIAATPGPQGLAALAPAVATPIAGPALITLVGEPTALTAVIVQRDGAPPLRLRWPRAGDGAEPVADGWGAGDAAELLARARGTAAADSAAAWSQIAWLARERLADWSPKPEQIGKWLAKEASDPTAHLLLTRCVALLPEFPGPDRAWTDLPVRLQHDLALRELSSRHPRFDAGPLPELAVGGTDAALLRAVLAGLGGPHREPLIDLLHRRLMRQAAGSVPLEAEPDLQHALVMAVFDAMHLSPTDLRPLALALRPRLTPYTRGPIERFLQRHGEIRPP